MVGTEDERKSEEGHWDLIALGCLVLVQFVAGKSRAERAERVEIIAVLRPPVHSANASDGEAVLT